MRVPLLRGLPVAIALTLACGDGNGPTQPALAFVARLDGQHWLSDTALAIAFASPTDTTLAVAAVRTVSVTEEQQISFSIHNFRGPDHVPLGDSTALGIGSLAITHLNGGVVVSTVVYRSTSSPLGQVTITTLNRADSIITGTFAFEAALTPDTAPHRHLTGSFTLRFGLLQVFPPSVALPPNYRMKPTGRGRRLATFHAPPGRRPVGLADRAAALQLMRGR